MIKHFSKLLIFPALVVVTSFAVNKDKEYIISITFPETKSFVHKDTTQKFLDIDARDCGWTTMIIDYSNEHVFKIYNTSDCNSGDSLLYSDILLTKKGVTSIDTISNRKYRYGCGIKSEFIRSLKGSYFLKFVPRNKLFKTFDTIITINSEEILKKGRYISVRLGNFAKTNTYKVSSKKHLTNNKKKIIRNFLWEHGIRGFCLNHSVNVDFLQDFVIDGKAIHIEQLK